MERKGLLATLREQKATKVSFYLLIVTILITIAMNVVSYYLVRGFTWSLFFSQFIVLIIGATALYYENRGLSFVAHGVVLILLLEPYLRELYSLLFTAFGGGVPIETIIQILIGSVLSIYMILKMVAHNRELNLYLPKINYNILTLLLIVLLNIYLFDNLASALIYLLLMVFAVLSGGGHLALPIVLMIYFGRLTNTLHTAFILRNQAPATLGLNALIYVVIIYYTIRLMRYNDDQALYS